MNAALKPIFLDLAAVVAVTSLAEATLQAQVREGKFPKPRQISDRRVGWLLTEIEAWAIERPVSELLPPANTGASKARRPKVDQPASDR
jgi:prophage regulatory protein